MSRPRRALTALVLLVSPALLAADDPAPAGRKLWAVVVGIDRYEDAGVPRCDGATRDAEAVALWLRRTAGWDGRHVLLMTESGRERAGAAGAEVQDLKPTRANLDWAVREWLPSRAGPGDLVLVYFAGQAVALPPEPGASPGGPGRDYLLPLDARASGLDATGWSLDAALDGLAARGANPVLCVLDTSPRGRGRVIRGHDTDPEAGLRFLGRLARWPGAVAWMAADGQVARERPTGGGVFTDALLRALGTARQPSNLLSCLDRLNRDPALATQGFRRLGGLEPELTLWPSESRRRAAPQPDPLLRRGHADRVRALAFTADGRLLATASMDSTVRVWRVADRALVRVLPHHLIGVTSLALSPDGRLLASGDASGRVAVWDLEADREKLLLGPPLHTNEVLDLAFLPDGSHLVSSDNTGRWRVWDVRGDEVRLVPRSPDRGGRLLATASAPGPATLALAVARDGGDDALHVFGPVGSPVRVLDGPGGTIERLDLAPDGRRLAVGTDRDRLVVRETESDRVVLDRPLPGKVAALRLSAEYAAVGVGEGLQLVPLDGSGEALTLEVKGGRVGSLVFSADGRWLAAASAREGVVTAWELAAGATPRALELEGTVPGRAVTLAFAPDGLTLAAGDGDGAIRLWSLPGGRAQPPIEPHRGQVAHLAVAPDRGALLQVTREGTAQLWALRGGRGPRVLEGHYRPAGEFLAGGGGLAMIDAEGDVVLLDPATGLRRPVTFARPSVEGGEEPSEWGFGPLAASPDGRLIAAGSPEGPLVALWDARDGRLIQAIRDHDDPITAVGFSPDGAVLLTAGEDGSVKLWAVGPDGARPAKTFRTPDGSPIASAAIAPGEGRRVAIGQRDGTLRLWDVERDTTRELGPIRGAVAAAAFTPDGRMLAAAGSDKVIRVWALGETPTPVVVRPMPSHAERINTLRAWPDGSLIASGSDDTTVRLWRLADQALLATLSTSDDASRWIAYTPEGLFDGSVEGEADVVRLAGREVIRLAQAYEYDHRFDLTEALAAGERPVREAEPAGPPPRLLVEVGTPRGDDGREVELALALEGDDLTDVRLYHNDKPIRFGPDFQPGPAPRRLVTRASLVSGDNRFFAMAGRPGALDGRSNEVVVRHDAPTPGRMHVIALGVSRYRTRSLQFAHVDAQQVAEYLDQNRLGGAPDPETRPIVLVDDGVSVEAVDRAFATVRRRVAGHPEDSVVLFVAGHTDVRGDRFGLLLPTAELSAGPELVAARSGPGGGDLSDLLQFGRLQRHLAQLDALDRLVVIDACQAEAIFDDPTVRRLRDLADREARGARTSYILAARRGEVANEVEALKHGLLTYALLRGLGAGDALEPVPGVDVFRDQPDADYDGDGRVDTAELRRYTERVLPVLAGRYPELVRRGAGADASRPEQALRSQDVPSGPPFPLVRLPRGRGAETARASAE